MCGERGVRVLQPAGDLVLLHDGLHLMDQVHYGLVFLVSFSQGSLEPGVGIHEAGDLLDGVDDEHVHKVFAGTVQPGYNKAFKCLIYQII